MLETHGELTACPPAGYEQPNRLDAQSSKREFEHGLRRLIEPLHVVDGYQDP